MIFSIDSHHVVNEKNDKLLVNRLSPVLMQIREKKINSFVQYEAQKNVNNSLLSDDP